MEAARLLALSLCLCLHHSAWQRVVSFFLMFLQSSASPCPPLLRSTIYCLLTIRSCCRIFTSHPFDPPGPLVGCLLSVPNLSVAMLIMTVHVARCFWSASTVSSAVTILFKLVLHSVPGCHWLSQDELGLTHTFQCNLDISSLMCDMLYRLYWTLYMYNMSYQHRGTVSHRASRLAKTSTS